MGAATRALLLAWLPATASQDTAHCSAGLGIAQRSRCPGSAWKDAALIEYTRCMSTCDVLCDVSLFSMCDVEVPEDSTSSHSPHRPTRLRCPAVR